MKHSLIPLICLGFSTQAGAVSTASVLSHYADLAHAMYSDSLHTAQDLQAAVNHFTSHPTEASLKAAKSAWVTARHPYQQTEAFRFGNPIVDDWEGKVNAWPLDEGLIDYVAAAYGDESDENPLYTANVIANPKLKLSNRTVDATVIDKKLLAETLHEADDVETNVATGYHAIEFLLWGQDLNGTGPGAGARPASDYDLKHCSRGNCDRRAAYLRAATDLLVDDLRWMVAQWAEHGAARRAITEGDSQSGLAAIYSGLGSLSYGELAGERMKLGLMLHDPEEEQDCFSDNTHWSHYNDALGILNIYTGTYTRVNGEKISGPSLSQLVAAEHATEDKQLRADLEATLARMQALVDSANAGVAYDQLIGEDNPAGNAMVRAAVDALVTQTHSIEKAIRAMGLESVAFAGSDSLDNPSSVVP